jgi:aspartyl-tRNA(Asn)/glutamyl-tRNA(Gln) amidotransferase subunit A
MHGLRIGVARESFSALVNPSVRRAINNTVALMCSLGATVEEFNLFGNDASSEYPTCDEILASYYAIAAAEATSNLARYDGVRFGGNGLRKNSTNAPNNGEWMQEFMVYVRTLGFSDQVLRTRIIDTRMRNSIKVLFL